MKASQIREMTDDELAQQSRDTQKELFNLRLQQTSGQIEKPSRIQELRRTFARINTVMRERQNGVGKE